MPQGCKSKVYAFWTVIFIVGIIVSATLIPVCAAGTTYYVDAAAGNDNNTGMSQGSAWQTLTKVNNTTFQPGDQILFKAGGVWNGTLYPKGNGASGSPITIDMYGSGNKPLINGNGIKFGDNGNIDAAVYLCDQDYWTIRNLEVTNQSALVGSQGMRRNPPSLSWA